MERRPKRPINKPPRYMTTSSSDEAPKRKKIARSNDRTKEGEIEEDIEELRTILEEDSAMDENNTLFNNELVTQTQHLSPQTQYLPSQTHTHTHVTYTNTPSYTNLDIYSNKTHNTCATTYTSHSSAHNYTPHVQNDILNHSATFSEFQDNAEQFRSSTHPQNTHQDKICDNLIHRGRRIENPMYSKTEEKDNR